MTSRTDLPQTWDERASLTTLLDYTRATARAKCEGLSEEHAHRAPLTTSPLMSPAAVISHLRWVEYSWFEVVFLGEEDRGPWSEEEPDGEMTVAAGVPLPELLDRYEETSARYRELVAAHDLEATAKRPVRDGRHVTLRWILLHLIEETARHNGHLDILREMADGTTGD
ncbi:DinB family protein [Streptomyces sodiiphilus]|uniref:DinB family protein n=1 Tax=Streptomyces sodiiphilus TaxID=226217 RepID=A0ABN2NTF1_9ACTN